MAKLKSKASSSAQSNQAGTPVVPDWKCDGSLDYSTKKVYTAAQRDKAVSEARESASNVQTQLERNAARLNNLKREISELEAQLHTSKRRYKDLQESFDDSLVALTRHLDSLR